MIEQNKIVKDPAILNLIGHTPLVEVTRFDTGKCRLFLKLGKSESRRIDQGPSCPVDDYRR